MSATPVSATSGASFGGSAGLELQRDDIVVEISIVW